jgi:zinc transport system permease protein
MILTLALAIVVAVGIKVVGVLLIVAMLIIPAASARSLTSTPEGMGILAAVIGMSSAILGLKSAYIFDTPTGPSIVSAASVFFLLSFLIGFFQSKKN